MSPTSMPRSSRSKREAAGLVAARSGERAELRDRLQHPRRCRSRRRSSSRACRRSAGARRRARPGRSGRAPGTRRRPSSRSCRSALLPVPAPTSQPLPSLRPGAARRERRAACSAGVGDAGGAHRDRRALLRRRALDRHLDLLAVDDDAEARPRRSPTGAAPVPPRPAAGAPGRAYPPRVLQPESRNAEPTTMAKRRITVSASARAGEGCIPQLVGSAVDEALTEQVRSAMPYAATLGLVRARRLEGGGARCGRVGGAADDGGRDPARRRPDGARRHRGRLLRVPQPPRRRRPRRRRSSRRRTSSQPSAPGRVEARSRPLHRGSRTIVVETDLFDEGGKHVARVTQTQAVL